MSRSSEMPGKRQGPISGTTTRVRKDHTPSSAASAGTMSITSRRVVPQGRSKFWVDVPRDWGNRPSRRSRGSLPYLESFARRRDVLRWRTVQHRGGQRRQCPSARERLRPTLSRIRLWATPRGSLGYSRVDRGHFSSFALMLEVTSIRDGSVRCQRRRVAGLTKGQIRPSRLRRTPARRGVSGRRRAR